VGEVDHEQGIASQGGSGRYDKATGLWEFYDETPAEFVGGASASPTWSAVLNQWSLVEADFQSIYGLDLERLVRKRSWRWFTIRVSALLARDRWPDQFGQMHGDSLLQRFFTPKPEE
jgi:hypothetical protein